MKTTFNMTENKNIIRTENGKVTIIAKKKYNQYHSVGHINLQTVQMLSQEMGVNIYHEPSDTWITPISKICSELDIYKKG